MLIFLCGIDIGFEYVGIEDGFGDVIEWIVGHEYTGLDMLEPKETDVTALFLFFVVLPLVAYFLLGRWSEVSKKKERLSLLTQCAGNEVLTMESVTAAPFIPLVLPLPKINNVHECARCYAPSTTRCSRCKSVRYWYDDQYIDFKCKSKT